MTTSADEFTLGADFPAATADQCAIISQYGVGAHSPNLFVVTNDPNAPARNLLIEEAPDGGSCP